jgi:hypothetical protein
MIAFAKAMAYTVGKDGFEPPNSEEDRFTVCCRWPLGYLPVKIFRFWDPISLSRFSSCSKSEIQIPKNSPSHLSESNQRPTDYKSVALPAELKWHCYYVRLRPGTADYAIKSYPHFWEGKGKGICQLKNIFRFFLS